MPFRDLSRGAIARSCAVGRAVVPAREWGASVLGAARQSRTVGCSGLNAAAALLHLTLLVALATIIASRDSEFPPTPLDEKVAVWENALTNATEPLCKWNADCVNPTLKPSKITTADGDEWYIYDKSASYGELSLPWLVLSFSALSFLFQGLRPCVGWNAYDYLDQVGNRTQFLRWIEYSFSASVMILCVAIVVNVTSYSNMVMYFTSTFATQFCGLVAELLLEKQPGRQKYVQANFSPGVYHCVCGVGASGWCVCQSVCLLCAQRRQSRGVWRRVAPLVGVANRGRNGGAVQLFWHSESH